jgi:hypothetical protein
MTMAAPHKIWIEQCEAARVTEDEFATQESLIRDKSGQDELRK